MNANEELEEWKKKQIACFIEIICEGSCEEYVELMHRCGKKILLPLKKYLKEKYNYEC